MKKQLFILNKTLNLEALIERLYATGDVEKIEKLTSFVEQLLEPELTHQEQIEETLNRR
ncbi:MAG: hypothetical protein FWE31_05000 [Firmicutes bacterium]|nr:hypothetical protein [Bacillota bacterium]